MVLSQSVRTGLGDYVVEPWVIAIVTSLISPLVVGFINTVVLRPLQSVPGKVDRLSVIVAEALDDLEDVAERLSHLEAQRTGTLAVRSTRRRKRRRPDIVPSRQ